MQISERNAWAYLDYLTNEYQPVVKLNGLFGVCAVLSPLQDKAHIEAY